MIDKLTDMEKETVMLISKYFPYSTKQVEKIFVNVEKSFDKTVEVIDTMLKRNLTWGDAIYALNKRTPATMSPVHVNLENPFKTESCVGTKLPKDIKLVDLNSDNYRTAVLNDYYRNTVLPE